MNELSKLKSDIEKYRVMFENMASMANEDASQINFGSGIPKEHNQSLAKIAQRFQEAMHPLENLRLAFLDIIDDIKNNESGNIEGS